MGKGRKEHGAQVLLPMMLYNVCFPLEGAHLKIQLKQLKDVYPKELILIQNTHFLYA